jgi:hypothetical protein
MPVDAHIFATADEDMSDDFVRSLASDLSEVFGSRLETSGERGGLFREREQEHKFLPDGLPHSRTVLRVCLSTPYYGPQYERGYWPEIAAALEFLRRRVPEGRVWYGRDDGDWVREATRESLDELWSYWATHGGHPYHNRTMKRRNSFAH